MAYNTKKYLRELKTKPYWEVEQNFWYYCQIKIFNYFRTALKNKMSPQDLKSALYGEFVIEGKPILEGFIHNLNFMVKLVGDILEDVKGGGGKSSQP